MPRFLSFDQFIFEKNVPLSSMLNDFQAEDMGDGKFKIASDSFTSTFSVVPLPKNMDTYEKIFFDLTRAIESGVPMEMYKAVEAAQELHWHFGNVVSSSLSLSNVNDLDVHLTDDQRKSLKKSEVDFLTNDFSTLPKAQKDSILSYLSETADKFAIVLECLFYYTRSNDVDKFYHSQDFNALLKSYQAAVDLVQEKGNVEFKGPFDSDKLSGEAKVPVDYVYWKVERESDGKRFILRAITSPSLLNSEESVDKKGGLIFSILDDEGKSISKGLDRFHLENLERKIKEAFSEEA